MKLYKSIILVLVGLSIGPLAAHATNMSSSGATPLSAGSAETIVAPEPATALILAGFVLIALCQAWRGKAHQDLLEAEAGADEMTFCAPRFPRRYSRK